MLRCGEVIKNMTLTITAHEDWEDVLRRCGAKSGKKAPPESVEEFHEDWVRAFVPIKLAYKILFKRDTRELKQRLQELDEEHTRLTTNLLNIDPTSGKRAIEKANARIKELEDQMEEIDDRLTNWAERYQEASEEMFSHFYALLAAKEALDDPDADNRRKARAVRRCIQKINLTFQPTGKKYPTSELVEIEIIPADPEYPNGASHCIRAPPLCPRFPERSSRSSA